MSHESQKLRMSAPPSIEALREIGLFGALSDDVLEFLATTLPVQMVEAGEALFREGDQAREMFVVLGGEVEVLKRTRRGAEARVALLGPGDWFGEMSILDVQPRSATVIAVAPSKLLRLTSESLDALYRKDLKAYSLIVLNVARELSRRLRVADGIIADFFADVLDEYVAKKPSRG
jgi:CRP-like cAMP-binding protein